VAVQVLETSAAVAVLAVSVAQYLQQAAAVQQNQL
jgi:hypothetical protein